METRCKECSCLEPENHKHSGARDCLIALAAARGQIEEDRKTAVNAIREGFKEWIGKETTASEMKPAS